jgi:hypothetical protein
MTEPVYAAGELPPKPKMPVWQKLLIAVVAAPFVFIIGLFGLGELIVLNHTWNMTPAERADFERDTKNLGDERLLTDAAKATIKANLKDPSSAIFGPIHTRRDIKGVINICGTVNARNSFGGFTGPMVFYSSGIETAVEQPAGNNREFMDEYMRRC